MPYKPSSHAIVPAEAPVFPFDILTAVGLRRADSQFNDMATIERRVSDVSVDEKAHAADSSVSDSKEHYDDLPALAKADADDVGDVSALARFPLFAQAHLAASLPGLRRRSRH